MTPSHPRFTAIALRVIAIGLLVLAQTQSRPALGLHGPGLLVTVLTVALVGALMLAVIPPEHHMAHPPKIFGLSVKLLALGLAVIIAVALDSTSKSQAAVVALMLCIATAALRYPLSQALPIGGLAVVGLLVSGWSAGAVDRDFSLILAIGLVFLITYSIKQRRATRTAEARGAVLAERARIAREIHDVLAHSLSAQLVHLEGAKLLLRADRTEEALERVTRARDLAKSGLEEARRAVSALREDAPALTEALRTLADEFESATGQTCDLRISGPRRRLSPEAELAFLRTAQEALTNVRRHAPGAPAGVTLTYETGACDLRVTNPSGGDKGTSGGGYGLMGMRERAELLGGTLSAGADGGAFNVHLRVPA